MARCLWVAVAALAASAQAQPLAVRHLTPSDGLANLRVDAVVQRPGGGVWVASVGLLDRYDGVLFEPHRRGAGETWAVRELAASAGGAVWAATATGVWRRAPAGGRFQHVVGAGRLGGGPLVLLADGPDVWVGTAGGLARLGPDGRVRRPRALVGQPVRALARDGPSLYAATADGLARLDPRTGRVYSQRRLGGLNALAVAGGVVWAGGADGRLHRLDPISLRRAGPPAEVGAEVSALVASEARPGTVWVGTRGRGLFAADAGGARPVPLVRARDGRGLVGVHVVAVDERGGALWAGTYDGLLHADATPPRFRAVSYDPGDPDGLRVPAVMAVHASRRDPDVVWAGTVSGGLHRYRRSTGRADRWFGDAQHPLAVAFAVHEAADGALWLGGTAPTLFRFDPGRGALDTVPLVPGAGGIVTDVVPVRGAPGHLWATTSEAGLVRVDTRARRAAPVAGSPRDVWTVHEPPDEPGALYAATQGDGLQRLDRSSGRWSRVEGQGCALDDRLVSLASRPGGALWVGSYEHRLFRLDRRTGACRVYGPTDGVPDESVGGLFVDGRGAVWLSTNAGLARLDPAAGVVTRFSEADGLPAGALYFHARDQTPAGEILVGGAGGFVAFDPLAVPIDTASAAVRWTGLAVDGEPAALPPGGRLVLPHDRNDVAVRFASADLRRPDETRYRVRLVGAEGEWRSSGPEVRYPLLPPGRYTLRVAAANRDGYWGRPAELAVVVRPPFWRTPWFWALVAAGLGAVGLGAHRYRVAQILRVERARRRIADDLHDDIGSKIASVALRLDAARQGPAVPDDLRDRLGRLGAQARGVVGDLRDTVWLVDADRDDLRSVADRIEKFAADTLGTAGRVERGGVPPVPLSMGARRDLYFLFTEALHNATRHAGAERVTVRLGVEGGAFALAVEDDGRGFEPAAGGAGNGLRTMRRRAEALGADLRIESAPGTGTRVRLRLPLGRRGGR